MSSGTPRAIAVDFETRAIGPRPESFPPEPVGVAIGGRYLSWGHPSGNNTTLAGARDELARLWASPDAPIVMHNARFDLGVAHRWMGLAPPPWERIHDTQLLLWLCDPHAPSLALKPSAERILGIPPGESNTLRDWLIQHGVIKRAQSAQWGAHIAQAPGDAVAPYAVGDTGRTAGLYACIRSTPWEWEERAYELERRLMMQLYRVESRGVRVDGYKLLAALRATEDGLAEAERVICTDILRTAIDLTDREALAHALGAGGLLKSPLPRTRSGRTSTARGTLLEHIADPRVAHMLAYAGLLRTCLATYLRPWSVMSRHGWRLYPSWHQVRGDANGTRTGRLSSSDPNFQNIPKAAAEFEAPPGFMPVPNLRDIILPEENEVWISADYQAQEIRMLAHYAEGSLAQMYRDDPGVDSHARTAQLIKDCTGLDVPRKMVKIVAFSLLYGSGTMGIAKRLGVTAAQAQQVINAYYKALPDVRRLRREITQEASQGGVMSLGGRLLTAPHGRDYALVNYLIQGSAADMTKAAIVEYMDCEREGRFLSTVHDEINISAPADRVDEAARELAGIMERPRIDVPIRTGITVGPTWGSQKAWKPK